jgi:hypothetical protein
MSADAEGTRVMTPSVKLNDGRQLHAMPWRGRVLLDVLHQGNGAKWRPLVSLTPDEASALAAYLLAAADLAEVQL